jgi:glycine/D-amino acid oxidase-like deaminating enzyme
VTKRTADVVICGAGIAGIAAAHALAVDHGVRDVVIVDDRPPLSLTSDKSTEAYRNWWPGPDGAMIALMNRSLDLTEALAEETGNTFHLNRRGYLYATARPDRARALRERAVQAAALGAGPLRMHAGRDGDPEYAPATATGFQGQPDGADLIEDTTLLRAHFPGLDERTIAALHVRRAGWFSGQQLGMTLLERARARGVRLREGRVVGVDLVRDRVRAVRLGTDGTSETIETPHFVNAAGPLVNEVAALVGVTLPVFSERHLKMSFQDHLGVVRRDAPLLIWEDPQHLPWREEERAMLAESEETRRLLEAFPPGVHSRPEGGPDGKNVLVLWAYHTGPVAPVFPVPAEPDFPEIALRGMAAMLPGLEAYFDPLPRPFVDGGYYTKTRENRPLMGPLPVEGAWVIGALSGFGLMAALGAGELLAAHLTGSDRPPYAAAFSLERYRDPGYRAQVEAWGSTGQL